MKNEKRNAKIATIIIFIALIRTITEPLRLHYFATEVLSFDQLKVFIIAATVVSVGLLVMTVLYYYEWFKTIVMVAVLCIVIMLILKYNYL